MDIQSVLIILIMKNIYKVIVVVLCGALIFLWIRNQQKEKELLKEKSKYKIEIIKKDSLQKVSDGYYRKLIADTLTKQQLKKLAEDIVELKNRKPISITKTIIQPVEIRKETDSISIEKDSVFIKDYYPNKENPFLKYTNRFSLISQKGISNFAFDTISLKQVVTKKEDGLYQIDFKGPDFLELKSIDIQTEPLLEPVKDNWGTLIGIEYGKNLSSQENLFGINVYQRYKKFYLGVSVDTKENLKGGFKIEF